MGHELVSAHAMVTRSRARTARFHDVEGAGESLLEVLPLDVLAYLVSFAGTFALSALASSSRALRDLCRTEQVCAAARKAEMDTFRRGMHLWFGTNGAVRDESE